MVDEEVASKIQLTDPYFLSLFFSYVGSIYAADFPTARRLPSLALRVAKAMEKIRRLPSLSLKRKSYSFK